MGPRSSGVAVTVTVVRGAWAGIVVPGRFRWSSRTPTLIATPSGHCHPEVHHVIISHIANAVAAKDLNDTLVGEPFSYEAKDGTAVHAKIAMVEVTDKEVRVFLDGVIKDGRSARLVLRPNEELWFTPTG